MEGFTGLKPRWPLDHQKPTCARFQLFGIADITSVRALALAQREQAIAAAWPKIQATLEREARRLTKKDDSDARQFFAVCCAACARNTVLRGLGS